MTSRAYRRALLTGFVAVGALSWHATVLHAQASGPPSRAEAPLALRLPSSARVLAMANAGLAINDGDALLYNPGALNVARGMAASIQRYGSNGNAGAIGSMSTVGSLNVGVAAQFVSYNAPAGSRWADAVKPGATTLSDAGTIAASSSAFTVGVGRTVKGFRVGGAVKYAEDRFGAAHDGTVAFDLGLVMPMGPANLAFVAQNLGAGLRLGGERGPLPRKIGVGWGGGLFPVGEHLDLGAQMQVTLEGNSFVRPAGGVELGFVPIEGVAIVVRNGMRLPRERDESFITGGLGVVVDRISVDYAIEPFRGGRPAAHRIGLRVR